MPIAGGAIAVILLMHAALTDGSALTVWLAGGAIVVGLMRTVLLLEHHRTLTQRTREDSVTDKLTGLPNRRALERDLERAFAAGSPHTLAFFDLDGFKEYNDAFGHAAGDALLQRLAPKLGGYRLGGDEFCVLLPARWRRTLARSAVPWTIAVPDGAADLERLHPVVGGRILAAADSMRPVARIVRAAQERYDGSGFPDGLRGAEIPLAARIIAACGGAEDPELSAAVAAARAARAPARSAGVLWDSARRP